MEAPSARCLACLAALLTAASSLPAQEPLPVLGSKVVLERFDVAKDGDLLLVPVTLGGRQHGFFLDTGATVSVFDLRLRHLLGKPVGMKEVTTAAGKKQIPFFAPPTAAVGKLPFRPSGPVAGFDFTEFREISGLEVDGALGMDFLRGYAVRIDIAGGSLEFLQTPAPPSGRMLPIHWGSERVPQVEVDLPGKPSYRMAIDTGNSGFAGVMVRTATFNDLASAGKVSRIQTSMAVSASGKKAIKEGILERMLLGRTSYEGLLIVSTPAKDFLGLRFLRRHVVTLDFPMDKAYLADSPHRDEPDYRDMSGLHLLRRQGKTLNEFTDADSAAHKTGVLAGDELVTLNGEAVDGMTLLEVRRRLSMEGRTVRLGLRRGEQAISASLTLAFRGK